MCVPHVCSAQSSEEGIRSLSIGVTGIYDVGVGSRT